MGSMTKTRLLRQIWDFNWNVFIARKALLALRFFIAVLNKPAGLMLRPKYV